MKNLLLIIALAFFMITVSCGSGSDDSFSFDSTAVTLHIGAPDRDLGAAAGDANRLYAIPSNITSIRVTVSVDETVIMQREVSVAGKSSATITLEISNGEDRRIVAEALDAKGVVLYRGVTVVTLGGDPVNLTIDLLPLFCQLYVNVAGINNSNCTDIDNPCKTITYALQQTSGNANICVAPGTYSAASGEPAFPITLKPGVGLKCSKINHSSIIDSGASPAILGAANASIDGCTVLGDPAINDNGQVISVNDGIIDGSGTSGIGITLSASSAVTNSNISDRNNDGADGVWITAGSPTLSSNVINGNNSGIVVSGGSPTLISNSITFNMSAGVTVTNGVPVINYNILSCNNGSSAGIDLRNSTVSVIDARNNKWDHPIPSVINSYPGSCPSTGEDICNDNISGGVNSAGSTESPNPCP